MLSASEVKDGLFAARVRVERPSALNQGKRSRRSVSLEAIQARDPSLTEASIVDRVRHMSDISRDGWKTR
jgi:hypothetical protein